MKLRPDALVMSDLHITSDDRDEYRWGIFKWACKQVQEHGLRYVFILGDLTDRHNNHSARLVNRLCGRLAVLGENADVHILKGNHDYVDERVPFFHFLNYFAHSVCFWTNAAHLELHSKKRLLMIPHSREADPLEYIADYGSEFVGVFMHHTFGGALASNGQKMKGPSVSDLAELTDAYAFSGDIHIPQSMLDGQFEYVGAPYPIRFGDEFDPRCLLLETSSGRYRDVHYPTIRKVTADIDHPKELRELVREGDQVRVILRPKNSSPSNVIRLRQGTQEMCEELGVHLAKITVEESVVRRVRVRKKTRRDDRVVLEEFASKEELDEAIVEAGIVLL